MNLKQIEEILEESISLHKGIGSIISELPQVDISTTDDVGFLVNRDWQNEFCDALMSMGFDGYGECKNGDWGFENGTFIMRPYYWGDNGYLAELPNFEHKRTGFKLTWYKYPLRASYMNKEVSKEQLLWILEDCKNSLEYK